MSEFDPKELIFGKDVQKKFLEGCKKVYDAVSPTMGPAGNFVVFEEQSRLYPTITKDGVSVARRIQLEDKFEDMAAQLMIESANKQVNETGDGTSLTILLTYELYKAGIKALKKHKSITEFRKSLQESIDLVKEELFCKSTKIDKKLLLDIATISANNNQELGKLISEAIIKVGDLGIVTAGKSLNNKTYIDYSDGYRWKRGIEYPEFMSKVGVLEYPACNIVVTNDPIVWANDMIKLVEIVNQEPTIIIAPHVRDEAMGAIRQNSQKGFVRMAVISPETIGDAQMFEMQDIADLTGATFLNAEAGNQLKNIKKENIGKCQMIKSTLNGMTTILGSNKETLNKRLEQLKEMKKNKDDKFNLDYINNSLAKLTGGIAEIKVHASTETEQKEIIDRVEDAILACRSAKEEGVVEGGGVALMKIANEIKHRLNPVIFNVLQEPIKKILTNADFKKREIKFILKNQYGYRVDTQTPANRSMLELNVIDPTKVLRTSLDNALSISGLLLQTTCCIAEKRGKR